MPATSISLSEAVELTRTGDVWLFRGRTATDRAIQMTTNSPVNHVGMALVIDDLPPLMWHAELGRSLRDMWTGGHHRGAQLHDLRDAVLAWGNRYGQRAWLRQLEPPPSREAEDAALRAVARLDGTPFPSTSKLATRWARGRVPIRRPAERDANLETAFCAEVVAVTYQSMGLLPKGRRPNWFDPGRFWSGDDLELAGGAVLGGEIAVSVPPS
ncbi:hypothetical protein [Actinomadura sp. WMMA1423]|uniref:hypothetical protein n=1 Tax=Actinomadura sp. WMMA1423 TaxID=2591108 RepID=UPI0011475D9A|nr:hypothetical protein [Actinomadura sp. WMMA1423]